MSLSKEDLQSITFIVNNAVSPLKEDISSLKEDVGSLKEDVGSLKEDVGSLKSSVANLEKELKIVKVDLLENNVIPRLNSIEACYTSTYDRYRRDADHFETAIEDIDVLKKVVKKHSKAIQKLQKQA